MSCYFETHFFSFDNILKLFGIFNSEKDYKNTYYSGMKLNFPHPFLIRSFPQADLFNFIRKAIQRKIASGNT